MSQEGPALHSFMPTVPIAAETTAEDANGNSTILEDQDQTIPDANDTNDSLGQQQDETIDDDKTNDDDAEILEEDDEIDEEDEDGASGTSVLPLSKIKKIFKTDPEHVSASEAAVFTTAVATELFIQFFTEQASLIARSEKRKKLQYKDFSSAVSNIEQLYFLGDTVPKACNLKKLVEHDKVRYNTDPNAKPLEKGQSTLNFGRKGKLAKKEDEELPESDDENDLGDDLGYAELEEEKQQLIMPGQENDDDNTDDENDTSIQEAQIRKDKDHDIIMN